MDETNQLIENQKKTLPPKLVEAIETIPWEPSLQKIGVENNLTADQIEILKRETMLVLYGFENPINFTENIAREVGLTEMIAASISDLIWQRVMEPINQKADDENSAETKYAQIVPEIATEIHPVIKEGEIVHDVTHVESTIDNKQLVERQPLQSTSEIQHPASKPSEPEKKVSLPDYRYPKGTDPYREPLN